MADYLESYLADIRRIPVLSRKRERELALAYCETGDRAAGHLLVTSNLAFVVRVARRYRSRARRLADLVQEGNLGLVRAVETYNPSREVRLITYAEPWIRARMLDLILQGWSLVRLGSSSAQRRLFFSMERTQEEMRRQLDPADPAPESTVVSLVASRLKASTHQVESMRWRLDSRDLSLDAPSWRGADPMIDCLEASTPRPDDLLSLNEEAVINRVRIASALGTLDPRERLVVELRVLADPPATLLEAGQQLGCGAERARQLEQRAFKKLRTCLQDQGPGWRAPNPGQVGERLVCTPTGRVVAAVHSR
jgi:RNA polymerase sigma-32 factor